LGAGLLLASAPVNAAAQQEAQLEGRSLGEAYLSASNVQYVPEIAAVEFVPFHWYLVVDIDFTAIAMDDTMNASNGLKGWELGVDVPPSITVTGRVLDPATSLNLGTADDWIIGTGQLVPGETTPRALVSYTGLLLEPIENEVISFTTVSNSSFDPPGPGWAEFLNTDECFREDGTFQACLRRFTQTLSLTVNPEPVPTEQTSFGSLKSRY
jgi:hypothetical protein